MNLSPRGIFRRWPHCVARAFLRPRNASSRKWQPLLRRRVPGLGGSGQARTPAPRRGHARRQQHRRFGKITTRDVIPVIEGQCLVAARKVDLRCRYPATPAACAGRLPQYLPLVTSCASNCISSDKMADLKGLAPSAFPRTTGCSLIELQVQEMVGSSVAGNCTRTSHWRRGILLLIHNCGN